MKYSAWLSVFLLVLSLWPLSVLAEDEEIILMDEVVVTASRFEQKNEKLPAQVTVITAEDIQKSGAQSVPEALQNLGGVVVSDLNGNGVNQTIDMGGFGEAANRHVAVVVNGRKINPIDQGTISYASIPIESVERIEVLYGGNSVLYGGDAMGGVINIITKSPQEGVHAWGEIGAGSYDTRKVTAGGSFVDGRFGGSFGAVSYQTDGYRDRSEADRKSAYAKLSYVASDLLDFEFEVNTTTADYELPGALSAAQIEDDRTQAGNLSDEGESREDYYVLTTNLDWGDYGRLGINLSLRNYERQDDMVSWGSSYDYDYKTLGVNPQYVLDRPVNGKDNRLTLGVEFYDTDYDLVSAGWATSTFDHDQKTVGYYAQNEMNLTESLILNAGARFETFDTTLGSSFGGDTGIDEDEWAWNLGLAYIFAAESKVYVRAYQAFRFPKVDEFMGLFTGVVNTDLTHERSRGYEAGARFVALQRRLVTNLRVYTFDVDDEIAWDGVLFQNENLDETRHQGGELDISFKVNDLISVYGGAGVTNAEFTAGDNDGNKIPLVPEFKSNVGFALSFDSGLTWRIQYNHLGERYEGGDNANASDKLDSADTVDTYLTYTYKNTEIFLSATNIFNEEYLNGWSDSYYPMPEAVYYGGVRFRF